MAAMMIVAVMIVAVRALVIVKVQRRGATAKLKVTSIGAGAKRARRNFLRERGTEFFVNGGCGGCVAHRPRIVAMMIIFIISAGVEHECAKL